MLFRSLTNWQEYTADTDPTDPASGLRISRIELEPDGVLLSWSGGTAVGRYLEKRSAMDPTNQWSTLTSELPPTARTNTYRDASPSLGSGFYRIRAQRP